MSTSRGRGRASLRVRYKDEEDLAESRFDRHRERKKYWYFNKDKQEEDEPDDASRDLRGMWLRPETAITEAPFMVESGETQLAGGVCQLVNTFDAFVIDPQGTLHDGSTVLPGAAECLQKIHEAGKPVVLLANFAGRSQALRERLEEMGLDISRVAGVVTSGDLAHEYLRKYKDKVGRNAFWIDWAAREERGLGPFFTDLLEEGDYALVGDGEAPDARSYDKDRAKTFKEQVKPRNQKSVKKPKSLPDPYLKLTRAEKRSREEQDQVCSWLDKGGIAGEDRADFLLVSGVQSYFAGTSMETLTNFERDGDNAPYYALFKRAVSSKLRMLCVNPDPVEAREGWTAHMDGSLAKEYETLGGEVQYFGKPGNSAFEAARELLEAAGVEENACHVGCSLLADVQGAWKNGLAAALVVETGKHAQEFEDLSADAVQSHCEERKLAAPTFVLSKFAW